VTSLLPTGPVWDLSVSLLNQRVFLGGRRGQLDLACLATRFLRDWMNYLLRADVACVVALRTESKWLAHLIGLQSHLSGFTRKTARQSVTVP
jgi:hypothetical protein